MKKAAIFTLAVLTGYAAIAQASGQAKAKNGPTEEEIQQILEANPQIILDVLSKNKEKFFDIVKDAAKDDQIKQAQEQQQAQERMVEDAIKNPKRPDIGRYAHVKGKKNARYTLVEYADFQCPYCSRAIPTVEALRKEYGTNMRFIFKTMPLVQIHPQALPSAEYFEAVGLQSQNKAWKFYTTLFANQDKLGEDFYKKTAQSLGVDMSRLAKDVKGPIVAKIIADNTAEFKRFGFQGTPGFLINGVPVFGAYPPAYFDDIVKKMNAAKKEKS
ncbi:MAG: DsbA family protein [Elusimicrobiota bacterium]